MATKNPDPINCPACGHQNAATSNFCISCGSPLAPVSEPVASPALALPADIGDLQREFTRLSARVGAVEVRLGLRTASPPPSQIARDPSPAAPVSSDPQISSINAAARESAWQAEAGRAPGFGQPIPPPPLYAPPTSRFASIDWETVMGRNWFAIIGAVALALGAAFFLRLTFENNWIGETGRVLMGLVGGLILLGLGEYSARRLPRWSQPVTGGGIAILYLSIYAAFGIYPLISPIAALAFLFFVVGVAGLLAIRYESTIIALMGIAGAFLIPLLLGSNLEDQRFILLGYILVVDLGILGVATFRNWRWFTLLGMIGTYLLFAGSINSIPHDELLLAQASITGAFLIFVGATTLFHVIWRRPPRPFDMVLMTVNAVAFYAATFGLIWADYEIWFGLISLLLAAFYGAVGYASIKRSGAPPEIALYSLATALLFLTISAPLQLTDNWVTVAWAAEGAILVWVGFTIASDRVRMFALVVLAIAAFRLLAFDSFRLDILEFELIANNRFPTFVFGIAAFYLAAFVYQKRRASGSEWERNAEGVLIIGANLLTVWIITAEVFSFYERHALETLAFQYRDDARNAQVSAITVTWTLYAMGLVAVAFARRMMLLRWLSLGLIGLVVAKFILFDTAALATPRPSLLLAANFYFVSAIAVFTMVMFAAFTTSRHRGQLVPGERKLFTVLVILANVVALWGLSVEAWRFLSGIERGGTEDLESAKHLTLTILWTLYAIGLIAVGVVRRARTLRLAGIALMLLPIAKLFGFDVFLLVSGYRVAAFVSLGVLLLALGLAYQRYSEIFRGFFMAELANRQTGPVLGLGFEASSPVGNTLPAEEAHE
jgi:uncharacterized membrane protein